MPKGKVCLRRGRPPRASSRIVSNGKQLASKSRRVTSKDGAMLPRHSRTCKRQCAASKV